jgi:hypothetical protein
MMSKQQFEQAKRDHIAMWSAELDQVRERIANTTATATDGINNYISRDVEIRRLRKRERQLVNVIASFA